MPKFAANLSMMFNEVPFIERFAAAARAGFEAVEFLFPYDYAVDDLKTALRQSGLKVVLFNTPPGAVDKGEWGLAALPGREEEARRDIDRALVYARALNLPSLHVMAGVVPAGCPAASCAETFVENLRYAEAQCAGENIQLLVEALSPKTRAGYLLSSQYQALDIVDKVDRANVKVQLDLFHAQQVDGNLSHLLRHYAGKYGHIQIASVPDRHEPDEGEINYPWLFEQLDTLGYRGWVGCEYHPRAQTEAGLGWLARWRNP
ncbi:hydroxypyruvate isomerase [Izhakiella australiensis]|uniref:Hydroxypyruvate isomerase n=1 Tax=Izhakiella australiensis TaxID=1926881 RepID=A0A1S8YRU3_9GAMM|nr:2-oxo-tetronate isomerase [Izhakiella australiensis]OON41849.1 hydroxypyruvate isomerase [Izhakiella australiensis]